MYFNWWGREVDLGGKPRDVGSYESHETQTWDDRRTLRCKCEVRVKVRPKILSVSSLLFLSPTGLGRDAGVKCVLGYCRVLHRGNVVGEPSPPSAYPETRCHRIGPKFWVTRKRSATTLFYRPEWNLSPRVSWKHSGRSK